MAEVDRFRAWLAGVDVAGLSDRERVELVASLERVKGAASAAQARATDALRCSREVVAPQDVARSVGSVVALARRESPTLGDRFVGLSRALVHEMPATMAALSAGECGERVAVAVVAATAALSREDRGEVDARVGPLLTRLGVRQAGAAAARVAAELDAASVVARMEAAVRSRRVTVRPAPDGMAYLSVLGPLKDVVGAHAALQARARAVVGGQCPEEAPEGRGVGAVAADTALALLSGRASGQLQPVEVHLVMTDRALLGTGDPGRSPFEPARIPGHGSVPAPVARAWLREGLTDPAPGGADASPPTTAAASPPTGAAASPPTGAAASPPTGADPDVGTGTALQLSTAARVWVRRLYTTPDGRDLVAMDSRRRLFGGLLRRMLVLRDDVCTTPWCEAPIVHADHATPVREHGGTSFEEGNGKCARCNHGKEAPGWRTRVVLAPTGSRSAGPERTTPGPAPAPAARPSRDKTSGLPRQDFRSVDSGGGDGLRQRRVVQVTTPLGHRYESEPPPLLGWGSQTFPPTRALPAMTEDSPATSEPKRKAMRQVEARRADGAPSWPDSADRRKRPLHRARQHRSSDPERPRPERRPRLTSHLERELCRYLT